MPIYEYECQTCGTTFEKRQSFSDEPVADCPNGHNDTRRLLSAPAIVFKGSGFYINDSRSSKNGTSSSAGKNGTAESTSESKSENKSESKSEAKSDASAKTEKSSTEA